MVLLKYGLTCGTMSSLVGRERKRSVLIITIRSGNLCNRLFQFAHLIAFCKQRHLRIVNLPFHPYAQYFRSTYDSTLTSFPLSSCRLRNQFVRTGLQQCLRLGVGGFHHLFRHQIDKLPGIISMDFNNYKDGTDSVERLESVLDHRLIFVNGFYFRDHDDFKKYADTIRDYFLPKECYIRTAQEIHNQIRQDADLVVGLHVRRGDYKGSKYYFEHEVYVRIIKDIVSQFADKRVKVLITGTDEPNLEPYADVGDKIVWPRKGIMVDLMGLSYSDYIVSVPSTFPQWASFYGKVPLFTIEDPQQPIDFDKASVVTS
jgi:hypothetical protein